MEKTFRLSMIFLLTVHLSFAQTKEEKKKNKEEKAKIEYEATKLLIDSGTYNFIATWAIAQNGRRIDLTTNSGYLKINKDTAEADLPYFGIAQVASYGGNGGIKFNNENVTYIIEPNDKKQNIIIQFKANHKSEALNLTLSVFKSGNASLNVSSSKRNSISYDGRVFEPDNSN
jgi:hypothetical protein